MQRFEVALSFGPEDPCHPADAAKLKDKIEMEVGNGDVSTHVR